MTNALATTIKLDPALAEMMGTSVTQAKASIARLALQQTAIMGVEEINGKKVKTEVVPVGAYRLNNTDGSIVYSDDVTVRVFAKRMHWGMWDSEAKVMYKTVMANDVYNDLKDTKGGFNLGRPSGYVKDWEALPKATKDIMRAVKRVTVIMGEVTMNEPKDEQVNPVGSGPSTPTPFLMEVRSTQGTKNINEALAKITRKGLLPIQYTMLLTADVTTKPDGGELGTTTVTLLDEASVTEADQDLVRSFFDYISRTNTYVLDKWSENNSAKLSKEDADLVGSFVNVEAAD